ncbi:MAG: RNA polymerase subunit sigma-24 [Oscillibacter sp.]|jgi:RNA polymerase sigma-70 factor (ECF subfamily)
MKTINLRWMYPHYRHDEFVDVTDEVWAAMYQAQREMENYERRKVYHRAYYSLDAYSWLENYALEHSRSPEDILLEREEMTTRLYLIAALPVALAHATPTQARRVHAYYIAGIKQPEISRREGVHSSKVSVAIRRGLRNMRRCYDDLFQTE